MAIHSIPVAVLAAISGLAGFFFLTIFMSNRTYLTAGSFALLCFSIVIFDIGCIGLYNAHTVHTAAYWQTFQFVAVSLMTISIAIFVHHLTGIFSDRHLIAITAINIGFIIAGVSIRNHLTVTPDISAVKTINIGHLISIQYMEAQVGFIYALQLLLSFLIFTICIFNLVRYQLKKGRHKPAISVAMVAFYLAGISDVLVSMGLYPFLYLLEYAFTGLILSMTVTFVNNFMDLHEKVEQMNLNLENNIRKKTDQLKVLSGLLPICASCKKIRDDQGYWNQIEIYVKERSDATFSHGICPDCERRLYPELSDIEGDTKTQSDK